MTYIFGNNGTYHGLEVTERFTKRVLNDLLQCLIEGRILSLITNARKYILAFCASIGVGKRTSVAKTRMKELKASRRRSLDPRMCFDFRASFRLLEDAKHGYRNVTFNSIQSAGQRPKRVQIGPGSYKIHR